MPVTLLQCLVQLQWFMRQACTVSYCVPTRPMGGYNSCLRHRVRYMLLVPVLVKRTSCTVWHHMAYCHMADCPCQQVQDLPKLLARLRLMQARPQLQTFKQLSDSINQLVQLKQMILTLAPEAAAAAAEGRTASTGQQQQQTAGDSLTEVGA